MSKKLRWGILGVAKINDRLMPSFRRLRNGEVAAIASRSLDRAQEAATRDNIPKAHGSYEALLDDPSIDVVYIPLPNTLHAEWTKKAAERGKHVMCEKPLCPTAAEAAEVAAFCRQRNVQLMDGFMWPHHPRTKLLREFLDRGEIGSVRRVVGAFTFRMGELDIRNIRLQPNLAGGSLLDVGCYPVYGIRWAMGSEPVRVWATAHYVNGCDVDMTGTLWFADGSIASFDCGFIHPMRQWLEIVGTTGTVTVEEMWVPSPKLATFQVCRENAPAGNVELHTIDDEDQMQHMLENFGHAILTNTPISPSPDEAIKTLKVLDALAKSARESKIVDV